MLLSTDISVVRGKEISVVRLTTEISVTLTIEISVKSSTKADETSFSFKSKPNVLFVL